LTRRRRYEKLLGMRASYALKFIAVSALGAAALLLAQQKRQVNDALLKTGSKTGEEWVSYSTNWSEQRFSPLTQINASNVATLTTAWSYDLPAARGSQNGLHPEATPLVFNGVMYSITPWSIVYALDPKTGKELWHSDPDVNQDVWRSRICCGVVNRGIALYEGKVIAPVVDGRIRVLDAATGKQLWITRVSSETQPYTITMAPRVIKGGKAIIGVSGGEYGVRGFFSAFDVNTGKEIWKHYTVPGDPSKPFEQPEFKEAAKTWTNEWWKLGGGAAVWNGFAYDPDLDLVYVGTGQPAPWTSAHRGPGDNLYSSSILAVKGSTGELTWYYQTTPGDDWDYDSIADIMLADLNIGGRTRQVLMQSPKNAFFYIIDRKTGKLISADPITKVSWSLGVDPQAGKMIVNPAARYGKDKTISVNPGPSGGHVWPSWSFNPTLGIMYIPGTALQSANYRAAEEFERQSTEVGPTGRGVMNMGTNLGGGQLAGKGAPKGPELPGNVANANAPAAPPAPAPTQPKPESLATIGPDGGPSGNVLYAWDVLARKERWRAAGGGAGPFAGGALATAGNIVFSSVNDRLIAYNAQTGDKLAEFPLGVSQMGPPMSVMLGGKQYIFVAGGPVPVAGGGQGKGNAAPADPNIPTPLPAVQKMFALTLP
jgi:PQQ-dependent dehydrogenase (methanol/ethanol family)